MTLTTHAVTGAVLGAVAAHNPALAALSGFVSHFILDAIPHWDYKLVSAEKNPENPLNNTIRIGHRFFIDLIKIGFDGVLGLSIVLLLFSHAQRYVLLGALIGAGAALLPDFLQFIYFRYPHEPFKTLQWFHVVFIHAKKDLDGKPVLGVALQAIFVAVLCLIAWNYLL